MPRFLAFSVLVVGLLCLSGNSAWGQKKAPANKKNDASPATPQQYALLATYKEMVGTIQSATTTTAGTTVTLRVEYDHPNPNANPAANLPANRPNPNVNRNAAQSNAQAMRVQQQLQKLQRDQAALQTAKNPAQYQQKLAQLARDQQALQVQLYQYQVQQAQLQQRQMMGQMRPLGNGQGKANLIKEYIDFELPLTQTAKVRRLNVGIEYDDKGNVKEPDPAAKGNPDLPGFAAKIEDLAPGAKAKVYLLPPKSAPAPAKMGKKDDLMLGDAPLPANRPQVRMVVMTSEPAGLPGPANKKKNK